MTTDAISMYTAYGTSNKPTAPHQGRIVANPAEFKSGPVVDLGLNGVEKRDDIFDAKSVEVSFRTKYGTTAKILIPSDATAWELYGTMRGVGLASYRLTTALVKALNKLAEVAPEQGIDMGVMAAEDIMSKARSSNAKYGAADTEPRTLSQQVICDFARAYMGSDKTFYHLL